MVNSIVECLLCKASLNLSSGNLDKFKLHLDTEHSAVFDIDLVISVSFLQTEEKERIVETVFPRIKKFFRDVKTPTKCQQNSKLRRDFWRKMRQRILLLFTETRSGGRLWNQNTSLLKKIMKMSRIVMLVTLLLLQSGRQQHLQLRGHTRNMMFSSL